MPDKRMPRDPFMEPAAFPPLGDVRLLDVREPAPFGLIVRRGIVRVPIESWTAAAKLGETSFENVGFWEREIAALGIDGRVPAVVCDDGRMTEAARVWFILQYFGVDAYILDGGWPLLDGRRDLLSAHSGPPPKVAFHARPGSGPVGLVDRSTLKTQIDTKVRILDARTRDEFAGQDLRTNPRGGHLSGARLLSHSNLIDGDCVKPARKLREVFAGAGFASGDHIVTHCDGGGRAALAAAAAIRAGFDDVRVYYLSFADWAKDGSCPIIQD